MAGDWTRRWTAVVWALAFGCGGAGGGTPAAREPVPATAAAAGTASPRAWTWSAPGSGPAPVIETSDLWSLSPFPNQDLTVAAPTPTGRRLALPVPAGAAPPLVALLDRLGRMDGFSVLAPIGVRFDAPLDPAGIAPDAVWLVDLDAGAVRPLDLEGSAFPPDGHTLPAGNRQPTYEDASHTLILRPLVPLASGSRHALVLTDALRGAKGDPLQAPAGSRAPPGQEPEVARAVDLLVRDGHLDPARARPVWGFAFTTGTPERALEAAAAALADPAHPIARALPPGFDGFADLGGLGYRGRRHLAGTAAMQGLFGALRRLVPVASLFQPAAGGFVTVAANLQMDQIDYVAFGTYTGADLRGADGVFAYDAATGAGTWRPVPVPIAVAVPRPTRENGWARPPYPVAIFGHGNTRSRLDGLALANRLAAAGIATVSLDFPGHGPGEEMLALPRALKAAAGRGFFQAAGVRALVGALNGLLALGIPPGDILAGRADALVDRAFGSGLLREMTAVGRAVDRDGDGLPDPGAEFEPTVDVFPARDAMRQSALDVLRLVSVLRGLGRDRDGDGRLSPAEGDLDGDGTCDLGGEGLAIGYVGQSLGGSVGVLLAGIDPRVEAVVANVGAGATAHFFLASGIKVLRRGVLREATAAAPVGLGLAEGTPAFRFLYALHQTALDEGDPAVYAARWSAAPGARARLLLQSVPADPVVPPAASLALARAAGFVTPARGATLASLGVPAGADVDLDGMLPVEAFARGGLRWHASGEHIYLIVPNAGDPSRAWWTPLAQRQAALFLREGGRRIEDDRRVLTAGP